MANSKHTKDDKMAQSPLSCAFPAGLVDCGPVLPLFPGQQPAEAMLTLSNPTDRPVEVVCLELDQRHRQDEEALKGLDM